MNSTDHRESTCRGADVPGETVHAIEALCRRIGHAPATGASIDEMLSALSNSLERTLVEHQGMAEELLSAYEQLGAVFEVTRKWHLFCNEHQVVDSVVEILSNSFSERFVGSVRQSPDGTWQTANVPGPSSEWLAQVLDKTVLNGSALAEPVPHAGDDVAEVLAAPVIADGLVVCAVVITRTATLPEFRAVDLLLVDSLSTFCADLIRNLRLVREVHSLSVAVVRSLVSAVDQKDEYTCGHSLRVAYFAHRLGVKIGMTEDELRMLQWSALLHDVGKIGIRDSVLKKPGKLTPEEFEHIKEHPVRSYQVVKGIPQLSNALDGILHHHERYDGKGYPHGLVGENIPLQARVIQIADVFDALTSNRAYRSAFSWEQALNIIAEEAGTAVDPSLQPEFDALMRDELHESPSAWSRMIDEANRFTCESEGDVIAG